MLVMLSMTNAGSTLADSAQTISWKESDNKILQASVCYNHTYGSIVYRQCRNNAQEHFEKQCNYFREKVSTTKYPYNKEFLADKAKFCITFSPVN